MARDQSKASARVLTIPNLLTLLRLLIIPFFIAASLRGSFKTAFILFVVAAVTDSFDGFIARNFNQRSRLGALFDPAADKVMMVCGYLYYTIGDNVAVPIPVWLTFVILLRDVGIAAFAYLLYTRIHISRFPPSWAGKASTIIQAITLAVVIGANAFAPRLATALDVLFRVVVVMTLYSGYGYLRRGRRQLDEVAALELGGLPPLSSPKT
ncbi:MAG TPA: CDP-alcohol phosphatidyltransferase family protein [Thermoanaerobaculia bacterium]|nr:CDP-alcohol phosphatidyltransferase family protein [Thermoanaerobaculia bacterium]